MNPVSRLAIRRPRLVIALWIVLAVVCVPLTARLSGALKAGGFDNPRGEAAHGRQVANRAFHEPPESLQVVLHSPAGDVTGAVNNAAHVVRKTPHVISVADYRSDSQWLSPDRHTTFLQIGLNADATTVQDLIADLRDRLHESLDGEGVEVHVTGAQALDYDLSVQSERDAATAEQIAFPLLFIVLLLVFRSVVAMVLPIVVAGAALVIGSAGGYLLTRVTDVSILFTNALSIIGLAVAVDYSLFIIKRYRDELAAGADYVPALQTATRTSGRSVAFSGLAVVVALVALFIPRIMVFSSIGMAGIVVTLVVLAMSATLLPAVLRLLGHRINWASFRPRRTRTARSVPGFITSLQRRPLPVLLILVALFGLMAWPMSGIRLQTAVASTSILPSHADSRQGIERLGADLKFEDLFPVEVVLVSSPGAGPGPMLDSVRAVAKLAEGQPGVQGVQAVSSLGLPSRALEAAVGGDVASLPQQAKEGFSRLWARDQNRYVSRVFVVAAEDPDSDATHDLVGVLRDKLPGVAASGVDVLVTGYTAGGVDFDNVLVQSLPAILGAVALITIILLVRAFRSWRLPLLALALNAMVVAASLGLLTLISQRGLGQRIDSITPVLVFAIMFGLSMDYMVIMISRMGERYQETGDHREAVTEGMRRTAGLVNGAALIMLAVFVSFLSAKISVVQQLGLGLAIAVTLDAAVIRLLVMPAALLLLGPRSWGRPAVPERLEIEEGDLRTADTADTAGGRVGPG